MICSSVKGVIIEINKWKIESLLSDGFKINSQNVYLFSILSQNLRYKKYHF